MVELVGALMGIFGRLVPEVVGYFKAKQDHEQEMAKLAFQAQLVKEQASIHLQEVREQGNIARDLADVAALREAVAAQSAPSGVKWIDGWNKAVRPGITTAMLAYYIGIKVALFLAIDANTWEAFRATWDEYDRAVLSAILGFWFPGRVLDKK